MKKYNFQTKPSGKFKTGKMNSKKSMFVYQEDIIMEIGEKDFTIHTFERYIVDFLNRIIQSQKIV